MFNIETVSINWGGRELKLETGRMARQADGAVLATYGDTQAVSYTHLDVYKRQPLNASKTKLPKFRAVKNAVWALKIIKTFVKMTKSNASKLRLLNVVCKSLNSFPCLLYTSRCV